MIYCKKCGLPQTYKGISIGEDGVCSFCRFYDENKEELQDYERLENFFQSRVDEAKKKARENGSQYDCIVGLSGGKDSTYIVYQMKHKYGMRVLAYTIENGFSTEFGRTNVQNALEKLEIDHYRVSMRDDVLRKYFSRSIRLLHNFCGVCFHILHYYGYLLAAQNDIPLIVNGRTRSQVLQSAAAKKGIEPFEISHSLREFEYQMFGRLVDKLDGHSCIDLLHHSQAEALSYFMYHKISEEETMRFLEEKIGWKRPSCGIPHADCWAHPIAEKLCLEKFKYPIRTGELGVLVREGELTAEEAKRIREEEARQYECVDQQLLQRFEERIRY